MIRRRRATRSEIRSRITLIVAVGLMLAGVLIADALHLTNHA